MSWRIVIIENRCKLDCKLKYMVVRGEETKKILIDEIAMVIIENPAISLTGCLLETLVNNKVKIIFCDNKHSPLAELIPYYGSYDCSRKIKTQINWSSNTKAMVWTEIVSEKIKNKLNCLHFCKRIIQAHCSIPILIILNYTILQIVRDMLQRYISMLYLVCNSGILEKLLDYMELVREFEKDKLFVFVNLRSYVKDNLLLQFFKTICEHEYKILLIENKSYDIIEYEKRITIDEDLCLF